MAIKIDPEMKQRVKRLAGPRHRYLAERNADAARRAVKAVGRPVDDIAPGYGEWMIDFGDGGYKSLYRIEGNLVSVLAVRHQREAGY